MKHDRCVFQLMKKHYERYDLETVSKITGTSKQDLLTVYKTYSTTGKKGQAGTIMYAMGWTQHTVGTQMIRTMAMIQLMLGIWGRRRRCECASRRIQRAGIDRSLPVVAHLARVSENPEVVQRQSGCLQPGIYAGEQGSFECQLVAELSKVFGEPAQGIFGDTATKDNQFGYNWLPKVDDGEVYSWFDLFDAMYKGNIKGFFAWGQNPACSGSNASKIREALGKLDWMVNTNIFDNETGSFWKGPGMDPSKVGTEVFMLPAAVSVEKKAASPIPAGGCNGGIRVPNLLAIQGRMVTSSCGWAIGSRICTNRPECLLTRFST